MTNMKKSRRKPKTRDPRSSSWQVVDAVLAQSAKERRQTWVNRASGLQAQTAHGSQPGEESVTLPDTSSNGDNDT